MKILRLETIEVNNSDKLITQTTSKGNQEKYNIDGKWVKRNHMGYEDIAEVATTMILKCSSLGEEDYVDYKLCQIDLGEGEIVKGCYSNDFKKEGESILTLGRVLEKTGLDYNEISKNKSTKHVIQYIVQFVYEHLNIDITDYLRKTITLDSFILNEDRHLNNFAFLTDLRSYRTAPIFDNGLSLLSDLTDYKSSTPIPISAGRVKSHSFSTSYEKQLDALGLGFTIDESKLNEELEINKEILGRAYHVIKHQMDMYRGTIVQ